MKAKTGHSLQSLEPVFLHAHIVGIVHIINACNGMPLFQEHFRNPRGDKAGSTGHQVMSHL